MTCTLKLVDDEKNQRWIFCTSTNPDIQRESYEAVEEGENGGSYPLNYSLVIAHALLSYKNKPEISTEISGKSLKKLLDDLKTAVKQGREFDKPNFLVVYPLARLPLDPEKTHYPAVVIDKSNGCYPLILDTTKRIKSFLSSIVNIKNLVSSQDIMGASEWTKELQVKILKKIPYFWWKDTKGVKGGKILYLKPQLEEVFGKPLDDGVSRVSDEAIAAKLYPR